MMNLEAKIKRKQSSRSDIGSEVATWVFTGKVYGHLDRTTIKKGEMADMVVEDTTHIFITKNIVEIEQGDRMVIDEVEYEVNYVDNPALMNHHLEIELKKTLHQVSKGDYAIYFGGLTEEYITEIDVLSLESQAIKSKSFTKTIDIIEDGFLYIIYPKALGKSSIRLGNKLITTWNTNEIMVNGVAHYSYSIAVTIGSHKIELF